MSKDLKAINEIRILGVDAINKANSGHPGIVLGAAPMLYTLFTKHLNIDPKNPKWFNRDRFVMAAGHGSALLYSMLHVAGYKISLEDMKQFRQMESITPGHPEIHMTEGIDATSGPLGQGVAMAVGFAVAEEHLRSKSSIVDHYTYALCGDGDLQEGVTLEAMSFAGHQKLGKLIVLYDSNDIQLDTRVEKTNTWNVKQFAESVNWEHILVKDGESVEEIDAAIAKAKSSTDKPTLIEIKTVIGFGAKGEGTSSVHGSPIGVDGTNDIRTKLGIETKEFEVSDDTYSLVREQINNNSTFSKWQEEFSALESSNDSFVKDLKTVEAKGFNIDFDLAKDEATRNTAGATMDQLQKVIPNIIGGSADLTGSTKIKGINGDFEPSTRGNNNINYGVREFAMGAIVNGATLHGGVIPFGSTFFVFSDYVKPALRMSALMQLPSLFVFSHDSVFVGEDGPTHQPIEQLATLRSIPNFNVLRPADETEVLGAYECAFNSTKTPSAIITTRQNLKTLENSSKEGVKKGAYIIHGEKGAEVQLLATGSEVMLAIEIAKQLESNEGIKANVVSMPSWFNFEQQDEAYKASILEEGTFRVSMEAGSTMGWHKYINGKGIAIGIDRFGESAPGPEVYDFLGFTTEKIIDKIKLSIKK